MIVNSKVIKTSQPLHHKMRGHVTRHRPHAPPRSLLATVLTDPIIEGGK